MKFLACLITASFLLTACGSSEASPQEKRNLFDACIIEWRDSDGFSVNVGSYNMTKAKQDCVYLLK